LTRKKASGPIASVSLIVKREGGKKQGLHYARPTVAGGKEKKEKENEAGARNSIRKKKSRDDQAAPKPLRQEGKGEGVIASSIAGKREGKKGKERGGLYAPLPRLVPSERGEKGGKRASYSLSHQGGGRGGNFCRSIRFF